MEKHQIERINELAKKQKAGTLTREERMEQKALREQYIKEFRANFQATLDRVYIEQEDGSYKKLEKKPSSTGDEL